MAIPRSASSDMSANEISSYSGVLEKRARGHTFLGKLTSTVGHKDGNTWQTREFRLVGQTLSYWKDGSKKGEVNVLNCIVRKLVPEEVNGREYGFELELPGAGTVEKLYLSAESSLLRAKWISVLLAAGKDEKWQLRPKTLLKTSGHDVAMALVAGPRDERQVMVVEHLMIGARKAHFMQQKRVLYEQLNELQEEERQTTPSTQKYFTLKLRIRDVNDAFERYTREHAAFVIQSFMRQCATRRRLDKIKRRVQCAKRVQLCIRTFLFRRRLLRFRRRRRAAHVIVTLIIAWLSRVRARRRIESHPRVIVIEHVQGDGIEFDEAAAAHDFFFYAMSCFDSNTDPKTKFRGCEETRVEHGYGLRTTSVYRSEGVGFNIKPIWKDQQGVATGSHKNCFIVITLVTKASSSATEVFHGQAVVRLADHPGLFDGKGTVISAETMIQKYVAPLETVTGSSILNLNDALHRRVNGKLSLKMRIPQQTHTMAGWLFKESGRMLSRGEFKKRYFLLLGDYFWYSHGDSELGNAKKRILCREITALTKEKYKGHDCMRIHFTLLADQRKGSWLVYFPDDVPTTVQREWVRKLHRCCRRLPNLDLAPGALKKKGLPVAAGSGGSFLKGLRHTSSQAMAV